MWSSGQAPSFNSWHPGPRQPCSAPVIMPAEKQGREDELWCAWVSLSSNVCQIKNEREGGQRIFQMESSEEGATRLPLHSGITGPSEHWAGARRSTGCCLPLQWSGGLAEQSPLAPDGSLFMPGTYGPHRGGRALTRKAGEVWLV